MEVVGGPIDPIVSFADYNFSISFDEFPSKVSINWLRLEFFFRLLKIYDRHVS